MQGNLEEKYRKILKTTSLFGGVQVLNIFFSIIRSKAAALFLGPYGIGLIGLYNSALNIITEITKLGIDITIVKEISYQENKQENSNLADMLFVVKRLIWVTGIVGVLLTALFSSLLSKLTFGNYNYNSIFVVLSIVVLLRQLTTGYLSVSQGFRDYKLLAITNVAISFFSVILTVVLYFFYGVDSIVYVIILVALLGAIISYLSSRRKFLITKNVKLDFLNCVLKSKELIKTGFYLSLLGVFALVSTYLFQIYLRYNSSVVEVGYYQAAFVIINTYIGLVFNALATEYFPRISAINDSPKELENAVRQQAYITTLLIIFIVAVFVVFVPMIVRLLYSKDFLIICKLLSWAMLGVVFKSASFTLGYVLLAKNDSRIFLKTSLFFNTILLILMIVGYETYGIEGIGIGYLVYFFIHFLVLKIISNRRYNITLQLDYYKMLLVGFMLILFMILTHYIQNPMYKYSLFVVLLFIVLIYVYNKLDKLINIKKFINEILSKR